jgi:hypothetical protein
MRFAHFDTSKALFVSDRTHRAPAFIVLLYWTTLNRGSIMGLRVEAYSHDGVSRVQRCPRRGTPQGSPGQQQRLPNAALCSSAQAGPVWGLYSEEYAH